MWKVVRAGDVSRASHGEARVDPRTSPVAEPPAVGRRRTIHDALLPHAGVRFEVCVARPREECTASAAVISGFPCRLRWWDVPVRHRLG